MADYDQIYDLVLKLVKEGGALVKETISRPKNVEVKSCDVDLVTETDKQVEKLLMDGISSKFPDHRFIGEETTASGVKVELTDSPTWIIDPVDGTMNFVHGFPHTCISIALVDKKIPQIGMVYNPVMEQLFTARKGKGAFLNGKPIHVSDVKEMKKAILMFEMGTSRDPAKMKIVMENLAILAPLIHGTRALGSAALNMCMVALGGADCNFEYGIHAWDIAAGDIIVREAGGVCIDPSGGPFDVLSRRVLCASTQELADEVTKVLVQYYPERD
ncbi:inositol monophosphatase 1 [Neodiprion pinetum]|uniref:Inositol-1-monophosphatase n=1 Tax=Neodiprion lecontei TaxID=441921 RepID=A0A6J0B3Y6_NEOLC|nr:inositol monophosphatase 1 [Neodiprion lecontei]XP_046469588.1 inositol monophosphatase 1-like [Neodiprion pinetum]XP_046469589.1 inositol monophosphatase 1-like [Neodiprion pinetum]